MRGTPLTVSRPSRSYDGAGGFVEAIDAPRTIYGDPKVNDNTMELTVAVDADVKVGDLIEIPHAAFFGIFINDVHGKIRLPAVQISGSWG